jgi:nucleoid-associated protein YgaU
MTARRPQVIALVCWLIGVTAALCTLVTAGAERPGAPPLTRPGQWGAWATAHDPLDVVAAGARLVAIAALAYLLVVTLVQLALTGGSRALDGRSRPLGRIAPRFIGALTAAVVATATPAMANETATGAAASSAAARPGPDRQAARTPHPQIRAGMGATMQLIELAEETSMPWAEDLAPSTPTEEPTRDAPAAPPGPAAVAGRVGGEWVVRPGDHLWGIAEEVLAERAGTDLSDAAVRHLWIRLIDANRDRLVDPEDPDLILPGQRLVLPD